MLIVSVYSDWLEIIKAGGTCFLKGTWALEQCINKREEDCRKKRLKASVLPKTTTTKKQQIDQSLTGATELYLGHVR